MQSNKMLNYYDYRIPILILVLCGVISIFLTFKLKRLMKDRNSDWSCHQVSSP